MELIGNYHQSFYLSRSLLCPLSWGHDNVQLGEFGKNLSIHPEMQAIHLESRRAIVSALSTLMGINPEEPTWH